MTIFKTGIFVATVAVGMMMATSAPAREHHRSNDRPIAAIGSRIMGPNVRAPSPSSMPRDGGFDRRFNRTENTPPRDVRGVRDWQRKGPNYDSRYYARRGY